MFSNQFDNTEADADDVVIAAKGLGKYYEIYGNPKDRLKQFLLPTIDRATGKDPRKYYKQFWALSDVSFEVRRGETIGVIGRNGSGKSTLLQLVCGTLSPSAGTMETRGRIAALLELGSGFNPEFTGRENVMLSGALFGLSRDEIAARYDEIVAFSGIADFIDQPVKTYSSGMVVRLAFSVIAHVDADILVVDEALSVGDAYFTQKCMRFLRSFMKRGTLLFCSHDMGAIVNLCNRVIWLDKGQLKKAGKPKAVSEKYLESLFDPMVVEDSEPVKELIEVDEEAPNQIEEYVDMRMPLINASPLRNDIEVFQFDEGGASFGVGGAQITGVRLLDANGNPVSWAVGGEEMVLEISARAAADLVRPIIGFVLKDKLGQIIFGDNTYIPYRNKLIQASQGNKLVAKFKFKFPILPSGEYSISPAIAEGTQSDHVQHHWVHDAMILQVHSSSTCIGLIGVPMREIILETM
ncbi:ABC transporter ATP-binding protein [Burkholderia oklahomensis]|uniref:ABC transporter ATP-binding protein n=1 Tax=Burkholderia oklahomensis TaxID=342113 RepID=UPI00016A8D77|nr:ABC transporter ATP-binding protein [Burkholderia oklahomensis]AJX30744.1 ABC transporter family protein [Burkholderia oklahomensis C6786]AOI45108.1 ABC transporter ATP-binding protein [Burkholderia oklahomensis C6786]KUY65760.1 ABC transporter ATP-binding protein [Burkholderia oklahomensis C6786]MBI0358838.1 ABC transporter ATP-binding protein [Burkholderia oklahomensis]SUW57330.1 Teichoic acids export ATP-binding protein TagH [Burkholderia oklahomensis]